MHPPVTKTFLKFAKLLCGDTLTYNINLIDPATMFLNGRSTGAAGLAEVAGDFASQAGLATHRGQEPVAHDQQPRDPPGRRRVFLALLELLRTLWAAVRVI